MSSAAPPTDGASRSVLDLLFELQALDRVPRIGYSLRGVADAESVAEHLFHVAFLVWALAGREDGLDRARAFEIALIHDLAEVRFGDLPRTAAHYLPAGAKAGAELAALRDLLTPLGADGERGAALLEDYQEGGTAEARFVRVCDKLQLVVKALWYRGSGVESVAEFADSLDRFDDGGFSSVRAVVEALERRRDQDA
ncbi:MAG: HD domain-containing protein [Acidobacteriota bacterium]